MGLCSAGWEERDYGAVRLVADGLAPPGERAALEPPTLVVVAWLQPPAARGGRLRKLVRTELDRAVVPAGSVLVLTNVETAPTAHVPVVSIGAKRLGALVDADAELRLRVPSVLGIRDLDGLLSADVAGRSTADLAAATELSRVFVPTRAYERAVELLRTRHFAVLTGPPEMGKTAIARTVALAQLTAGWEAHECIRPEQLWSAFARDRPQVFVADDAFGSTEYRPEAAERWSLELDRVLRALDERHWLIWTSRPAPLKAALRRVHREHGVERFPQPAEVQVDAAALGVDEKALILFRHAKSAALPREPNALVRARGWEIVSHPHFTPERIRRFVGGRLLELSGLRSGAAIEAEMREPTAAMAASFAALAPEYRAVLVAMLDAPPGPVPERELAAAVRRLSESGFAQTPAEVLERLLDHFLRLVPPTSVAWVHPSWRDLVIAALAEDAVERRRFLERCGLEGILLALSVAGGATGERLLPLLCSDADWDVAAARVRALAADLDAHSAIRLLGALGAALEAELPERLRAEAAATASLALERLAAAWDERRRPLPVAALEAWFALSALLPAPPPGPRLGATWIELVPTERVDLGSRPELVRFDEWLTLAGILDAFAPEELERFGFPELQRDVLAAFVADVSLRPAEEVEELLLRILRRVRRVAPDHAAAAAEAAHWLAFQEEERWFEVRFETHTRAREPAASDRSLVERVLRDL